MQRVLYLLFSITFLATNLSLLPAEQKSDSDTSSASIKTMHTTFASLVDQFKQSCARTCDHRLLEQAMQWHFRTLIRARQDISCCTDESVSCAPSHIQLDHGRILSQLVSNKLVDESQLSSSQNKPRYKQALEWVQEQTDQDALPTPHEITDYGMQRHLDALSPEPQQTQTIVPEDQWKAKRQAVLDEIAHELDK